MQPSTVVILGSTGSIGTQGLDVISRHLDRFTVTGLAAGGAHVELLAQQAAKFHVPTVAIFYKEAVPALREALEQAGAGNVNITAGPDAVIAMAGSGADVVLNGITGSIGLEPSIAALQAGSQLALANKESVVAGGHLLFSAQVRDKQINPVDSEHSAIWQSLRSGTHGEVSKLVVTASGGPFRGWTREETRDVTPEMAVRHPNWSMGAKISVDSATMMNKGLEFIEAMHLFGVTPDDIQVLIHPESVVHSMVELLDGTVIAQLGVPDMGLPIQYALTYPERRPSRSDRLDFTAYPGGLHFYAPDLEALPCLALAMRCARTGGTAPTVMNAANEVAVHLFLDHKIGYHSIYESVAAAVDAIAPAAAPDLDVIRAADQEARAFVRSYFHF